MSKPFRMNAIMAFPSLRPWTAKEASRRQHAVTLFQMCANFAIGRLPIWIFELVSKTPASTSPFGKTPACTDELHIRHMLSLSQPTPVSILRRTSPTLFGSIRAANRQATLR
jgi:hypothetical protein